MYLPDGNLQDKTNQYYNKTKLKDNQDKERDMLKIKRLLCMRVLCVADAALKQN